MDFFKEKKHFVGIDSDGTVFDSMKLKHTFCFIPTAILVFGLEECATAFKEIAERINLYSLNRGVNRFPGLIMTFEELIASGCYIPSQTDEEGLVNLKMYINSGFPLSNAGLEEWLEKYPCVFGEKVLQWSKLSDVSFERATEGIAPYEGVTKAIDYMQKKAHIMVVSAASSKGLKKDWGNAGLAEKVSFIAGQEFGKKVEQLLYAKEKGFCESKMLMIGDAPGDYEAAKKVGAWFYPIIPSMEIECWNDLHNKYFDMFVTGQFDESTEKLLYKRFKNFLEGKSAI